MSKEKHNHENGMMECEACKNGIDSVLEKQDRLLKTHGWYAHHVVGVDGFPYGVNSHTHHVLENFKHVDLQICLPIEPNSRQGILENVVDKIKEGSSFEAGKSYESLLRNTNGITMRVLFLEATENDRKVLRLIFPETDGSFLGEMSEKQMEGCVIPDGLVLNYMP